ncbi:hypothetical protein [Kribbella sp. NPDC055071]
MTTPARPSMLNRNLVRFDDAFPGSAVPMAPRIDAIFVPTIRPVAQLQVAVSLARRSGATLIAMCSGSSRAAETAEFLIDHDAPSFVGIQLPPDYSHPMLDFSSSRHDHATEVRVSDLSVKRNLGLLLGRAMRWRRLLFLDDDTFGIEPADLARASRMLDRAGAVGFFVDDFPDHSVVGHALRFADATPRTFVTGGALLVDATAAAPFFPDTYNEDWLFLHEWTARREVSAAGTARQLPYAPFADPARARGEEFGDLLAEGLHQLMHDGLSLDHAGTEFWFAQISERGDRIRFAAEVGGGPAASPGDRERIRTAMRASLSRLDQIDPASPPRFIKAWRYDLRAWEDRYQELEPCGSLGIALKKFDLVAEVEATRSVGRQWRFT